MHSLAESLYESAATAAAALASAAADAPISSGPWKRASTAVVASADVAAAFGGPLLVNSHDSHASIALQKSRCVLEERGRGVRSGEIISFDVLLDDVCQCLFAH